MSLGTHVKGDDQTSEDDELECGCCIELDGQSPSHIDTGARYKAGKAGHQVFCELTVVYFLVDSSMGSQLTRVRSMSWLGDSYAEYRSLPMLGILLQVPNLVKSVEEG